MSIGQYMSLQQIFIGNLKRIRKERGFSQMTLSERCDTTSNYIGQIEMGRRIPSFEKIEKIAAALEIPIYELFMYDPGRKKEPKRPTVRDYLRKMPQTIKRQLISRLLATINTDIKASLDSENY
jgi:transcriptional regulator with XRE-family HTH domain